MSWPTTIKVRLKLRVRPEEVERGRRDRELHVARRHDRAGRRRRRRFRVAFRDRRTAPLTIAPVVATPGEDRLEPAGERGSASSRASSTGRLSRSPSTAGRLRRPCASRRRRRPSAAVATKFQFDNRRAAIAITRQSDGRKRHERSSSNEPRPSYRPTRAGTSIVNLQSDIHFAVATGRPTLGEQAARVVDQVIPLQRRRRDRTCLSCTWIVADARPCNASNFVVGQRARQQLGRRGHVGSRA